VFLLLASCVPCVAALAKAKFAASRTQSHPALRQAGASLTKASEKRVRLEQYYTGTSPVGWYLLPTYLQHPAGSLPLCPQPQTLPQVLLSFLCVSHSVTRHNIHSTQPLIPRPCPRMPLVLAAVNGASAKRRKVPGPRGPERSDPNVPRREVKLLQKLPLSTTNAPASPCPIRLSRAPRYLPRRCSSQPAHRTCGWSKIHPNSAPLQRPRASAPTDLFDLISCPIPSRSLNILRACGSFPLPADGALRLYYARVSDTNASYDPLLADSGPPPLGACYFLLYHCCEACSWVSPVCLP